MRRLKPDWIIHTGDLADDVKVELYPQLENLYAQKIEKLLAIVEEQPARVVLVMGNHDVAGRVREKATFSTVLTEPANLKIGKYQFRVGHSQAEIMKAPQAINLFGHDLTVRSGQKEGRLYLNGLEGIHLICPETGLFRRLRYPIGTDDSRLVRRRCRP